MSAKGELRVARERAREEKALAKQRFSDLKSSLAPSAVLARLGRRTATKGAGAAAHVRDLTLAHPILVASSVAALGLVAAAKPLGEFVAAELNDRQEGEEW